MLLRLLPTVLFNRPIFSGYYKLRRVTRNIPVTDSRVQYTTHHFRNELPSQLLDWYKNPVFPTNCLADTSKPNLNVTKTQHNNLNNS